MDEAAVFTAPASARSTLSMPVAGADTSLKAQFAWMPAISTAPLAVQSPAVSSTGSSADQAWFWTTDWQQGEREVDEYIAAGHTEYFDSADEFLAALDREIS